MLMQILITVMTVQADTTVSEVASNNGFNPSNRIVKAIDNAANAYKIPKRELASIAIVESGMNPKAVNVNKNGSTDIGMFQINTVNHKQCSEYNLLTPEGNSLCAAKLLNEIRKTRLDYLGVYHSKTPSKKEIYLKKIKKIVDRSKKLSYVSIK